MKEAGASPELRTWFGHDPGRWEEFQRRYFEEISQRPSVVKLLKETIQEEEIVTFVFAAHDERHNNAVALKEFLEGQAGR